MADPTDRRARRTRTLLINAFNTLVLSGGPQKIRVTDIIEQADVARSTFYEHYANADELHMQALRMPLGILADAMTGIERTQGMSLTQLLEHFWDQRQRARTTFAGRTRMHVSRVLVEQLELRLAARVPQPPLTLHLAAMQLAEAPLALIDAWVRGDLRCTADALGAAIMQYAHPVIDTIFEPVAG